MRVRNTAAALLALGATAALGAESEMHVTVYNNDLALVKEVREVELPEGVGEFSFVGVPARIDPTSVRLDTRSGGKVAVLEQNFQYDLVSSQKLMERFLDKSTRIVTKHDKVHEGILKTTTGSVVLETDDGVVILSSDEIADISFPEIPAELRTRPTLVWLVRNQGSATQKIEIAYLTEGLAWHTEYVAAVDKDDRVMHLSGWVSIDNQSGGRYENAHLKVVAGDVNRVMTPQPRMMRKDMMMAAEMGGGAFEERSFFEYHVYDLGRETTLADREVKQIQLFPDREVPVTKVYVYEPMRGNDKVQVKLEFENTKKNDLGIPFPAGKFRVYREDADGALEFAGEDRIEHTAKDEKISAALGNAFDLVGERVEKESKRIADRVRETAVEIKLRNRKDDDDVKIIVREHPGGDFKVLESSHPGEKKSSQDLEFEITVPAGEEVVLTYRVRSQY